MTPELFSVSEAAEYAGVHPDTIHRWIRSDGLSKLQPNGPYGVIRIRTEDLEAFLTRDDHERLAAKVRAASITKPQIAA
ncbi:MAG: helix-turn-helix domain-containing protein [Solirubrobacterales bacterium]